MKKPSRMNFVKIRDQYAQRGVKGVRLTQSSLFLTQLIDPTKTSYTFDILESQNASLLPDEIRLNINDEFIATHMGIYLYGDISSNVQAPKDLSPQLITYAPTEMNLAVVSLKNLYSGQLKVAVNNIVYLEKWDTRKHEVVPRTQMASFIAGVPVATTPSLDYEHDAMSSLEPMLTFSGAKKNDITLNMPKAMTGANVIWVNQSGESVKWNLNRIALRFFGLNAQNASKFQ